MKEMLNHELARTDRGGPSFTVIRFHVDNSAAGDDAASILIDLLQERLRQSDVLGSLDSCIVAFLPQTSAPSARRLGVEMVRYAGERRVVCRYDIISYPDDHRHQLHDIAEKDASTIQPTTSVRFEKAITGKHVLWKRAADLVGGFTLLLLSLPLMAVVTVFIKFVSPGPALFKQERVGHFGELFLCWKFRTMKVDADPSVHQQHLVRLADEDIPMKKLDGADSRIIPFGKILRTTGIDELPQLLNVIRGEMSLVGPRPCLAYEAQRYRSWQWHRFTARPGLTGLWQVSGKNRTTFTEMMRLDVRYSRSLSLFQDMAIIFKTLPAIAKQVLNQ